MEKASAVSAETVNHDMACGQPGWLGRARLSRSRRDGDRRRRVHVTDVVFHDETRTDSALFRPSHRVDPYPYL
ncbi:hypothetical protein NJ7G_0347 [Natrinema sp. J7-2]|nr:hypothetical protein NJ7G_0347 [Natrinema sp. J7-2]